MNLMATKDSKESMGSKETRESKKHTQMCDIRKSFQNSIISQKIVEETIGDSNERIYGESTNERIE